MFSRSYGVTASTLDSESSDRGSNPRRTFFSGALGAWFSAASGESENLAALGPHSLVSLLLFWGAWALGELVAIGQGRSRTGWVVFTHPWALGKNRDKEDESSIRLQNPWGMRTKPLEAHSAV